MPRPNLIGGDPEASSVDALAASEDDRRRGAMPLRQIAAQRGEHAGGVCIGASTLIALRPIFPSRVGASGGPAGRRRAHPCEGTYIGLRGAAKPLRGRGAQRRRLHPRRLHRLRRSPFLSEPGWAQAEAQRAGDAPTRRRYVYWAAGSCEAVARARRDLSLNVRAAKPSRGRDEYCLQLCRASLASGRTIYCLQ